MVWNEEEAKNPIYLRILKPKEKAQHLNQICRC